MILDDSTKQVFLQQITNYAEMALRTICLVYKDLTPNEGGPDHDEMDE